jgi:hypothetical protein
MYLYICNIGSEIYMFNVVYLSSSGRCMYVSEDVRICGYFSKPEELASKKKKKFGKLRDRVFVS